MQLKRKITALISLVILTCTLSGCTPKLYGNPSASTIIQKAKKNMDYQGVTVNANLTQGKRILQKESLEAIDKRGYAFISYQSPIKQRMLWMVGPYTYYKNKKGIFKLKTSPKDSNIFSSINSTQMKADLDSQTSDLPAKSKWKVDKDKNQYVLSYTTKKLSPDELDSLSQSMTGLKQLTQSKTAKFKHIKYQYYFSKSKSNLTRINEDYQIEDKHKTYNYKLEGRFHKRDNIQVPKDIKDKAIDVTKAEK